MEWGDSILKKKMNYLFKVCGSEIFGASERETFYCRNGVLCIGSTWSGFVCIYCCEISLGVMHIHFFYLFFIFLSFLVFCLLLPFPWTWLHIFAPSVDVPWRSKYQSLWSELLCSITHVPFIHYSTVVSFPLSVVEVLGCAVRVSSPAAHVICHSYLILVFI